MRALKSFPFLLESFFVDRLMRQMKASPHTIASYRDTFRLLLLYAQERLRKAPSQLAVPDLDSAFIGEFLDYLEKGRDNSARSRNVRLAAIHSFFRYVALNAPEFSALSERVRAMPGKRYVRRPVSFLTKKEAEALLAAPDLNTWTGRRDRAILLLTVQTGLRAAELMGLRCEDITLSSGAHVQCLGKGRKARCTPLRKDAVAVLRGWLRERQGRPSDPLFPTMRGNALGHDGLEYLVDKHLAVARRQCPSLAKKRVTFHSLRHSCAMNLLHHGVDPSVIALWLGHENVETTSMYLHADMKMKEDALSKTASTKARTTRYRPSDRVMAMLDDLTYSASE
jgi:site-specific recombinase XerD